MIHYKPLRSIAIHYGPLRNGEAHGWSNTVHYDPKRGAYKTPTPLISFQLVGDNNFWHGFHRTLLARLKYSKAKTFLYRFDVVSETMNHHKLLFAEASSPGACHADDKSYLFKTAMGRVPEQSSVEYRAVQRMVSNTTEY